MNVQPKTASRKAPVLDPLATPAESEELGADLARMAREEQVKLDRKRTEELARLRAVADMD